MRYASDDLSEGRLRARREARRRLGHAIRVARERREEPDAPAVIHTLRIPARPRRRWHELVAAAVALGVLLALCVIVGTGSCGPEKPHTNELGVWAMDVPRSPSATQWDIGLIRSGYREVSRRVVTNGEDVWLEIGLRPSR